LLADRTVVIGGAIIFQFSQQAIALHTEWCDKDVRQSEMG